ncbi:uroporphyrinogen decarboxylase (URO-D) [Oxobacter pfennigii]|uniref:Uroporphyrinogen decarboxylase (URO-D) n=1 Tax=Oxobacter pfennigii TaxID=36849 RepID=A0A0P8YV40_9CLOT|nr:uroporphyrinogen decarboxylase (URO-D) [Oxobacter pfennigii]
MTDALNLAQERTRLFQDLKRGFIPKRVPISVGYGKEFCLLYAGHDLLEGQWNSAFWESAFDKVCQEFISDTLPVSSFRFPAAFQILESKQFVMSSSGFMQHPEVIGMEPEEYDELIKAPYDFIVSKVLPRVFAALDTDPTTRSIVFAKAMKSFLDDFAVYGGITGKLRQKYGYAISSPLSGGFTLAPLDIIADWARGFTGIVTDIRRFPEKVEAACEAVVPIALKMGIPPKPSIDGTTFIPLHMGPFMREKDFAKFYWPTFKKVVQALADSGQGVSIFVEQNWMRFIDYLYELPENTQMKFEYGDPKLVKDKLGKKHILSGFYPVTLLKTGTKEQCIDKAKELIDILAPGGRYWFDFDKSVLVPENVNLENLKAVLQYVYENTNYSDYKENTYEEQKPGVLPSREFAGHKYYKTWNEYRETHPEVTGKAEKFAAPVLQSYEETIFRFITSAL